MKVVFLEDINEELVPMEHFPEWFKEEGSWQEDQYNYRLNMCDTVLLLMEDEKVIGHMGIYQDTIKGVAISQDYQGQGLSYKLYEFAFSFFDKLYSDDAREPAATKIWQKLQKQYSGQITYDKRRDQFIFEK